MGYLKGHRLSSATAAVAAFVGLCACSQKPKDSAAAVGLYPAPVGSSVAEAAPAAEAPLPPAEPPSRASASESRFPPWDWCARTGSDDGYTTAYDIADDYWTDQEEDCHTAGLTLNGLMGPDDFRDWFSYLIGYTYLLLGCPLVEEPVEGGTSAFGPANTPVLGKARPLLSRAEVTLLIEFYEKEFFARAQLSPEEEALLDSYLWQTAKAQIGADSLKGLSTCDAAAEGVADAGAADAGK